MRKNNLSKSNKGITLIALVITIIVLLILAAIALNALLGENGIMNRAGKAKELYNESAVVEYISLKIAGATDDTPKSMLEKLQGIEDIEIEEAGEDAYHVTKDGYTITIYENGEIVEGTVDVWDDTSVESPELDNEFNWYIYNCAQLKFLADFVNNGSTLTEDQKVIIQNKGYNESDVKIEENTIVYLMNDLDVGARINQNGDLIQGTEWTPIGCESGKYFYGIFEGNNHYISGVYVKQDKSVLGLFGYAEEVRNLTIKNSYVEGTVTVGGITGATNKMINCHNVNTNVKGMAWIGGLTGQVVEKIENCTNKGTVITTVAYVGGIVGSAEGSSEEIREIINCTNYGKVYGGSSIIGGIVGIAEYALVDNCVNFGEIGSFDSLCVAGIAADSRATVKNCVNNGLIKGTEQVAGIVANMLNGSIENCTNNGKIIANEEYLGGIVGVLNPNDTTGHMIKECINNSVIEMQNNGKYVGGILGGITTDSQDPSTKKIITISECANNGKVSGFDYTGGIVGLASQYGSVFEKNYNTGEIVGNNRVGGIAGQIRKGSKIENSYNTADITGVQYVGGLTGYANGTTVCIITNSYNIGALHGDSTVGGLIGENETNSTITNSYYLEGKATADTGNGTTTDLAKNEEYIKTTFMQNANNTETIWEIRNGENNNFPVLIKK